MMNSSLRASALVTVVVFTASGANAQAWPDVFNHDTTNEIRSAKIVTRTSSTVCE